MLEGFTYTQQIQNLQFQSHKDRAVVKELQSQYHPGNQQLHFVLHAAFKKCPKIIQTRSPKMADPLIPSGISKVIFIWM